MDFRHFFDSKKISFIAIFAVLTTFSVAQTADSTTTAASPRHEAHGDEEFKPREVIMEHISDAHDWHLWGHTSIPLPVILYTDKGLEFFLSSQFHHGEHDYQGKHYTYRLVDKKKIQVVGSDGGVDEAASKNVWDFSITKNVSSIFLSVFLLVLIFSSVARTYKKREGKAPKGFQSFIEPIILFVRDDIARPN